MKKVNYIFIALAVIGWLIVGCLTAQNQIKSARIEELREIVSRQGFAIESLEKQKSSATYVPKYLDSIPDYD